MYRFFQNEINHYLRVVLVVVTVVDENEFCRRLSLSGRNLELGRGDRHDNALVHVVLERQKGKKSKWQKGKKATSQKIRKQRGKRGNQPKRGRQLN